MSHMSDLDIDLQNLRQEALERAIALGDTLQAIADIHWQGEEQAALFRATRETLESLREIELIIDTPISEIHGAAV